MLEAVPHRSEHIDLASFGSAQLLLRRLDDVINNLKTPRGDLIPISTLVVPTIAAPGHSTTQQELLFLTYHI